jgi:hypothetical protein
MANTIKEQKVIDTNKRALLKYVFLSDGTSEANTLLVDVSSLSGALNANGQIMSSNVHPKRIYKTRVKRIFGQGKVNSYVTLAWSGLGATGNIEIVTFADGGFDYNFENLGDGAVIGNPGVADANCNGDIVFSINGNRPNDAFTLFIDLRKESDDYSAGQFADPVAFNQGPAAVGF